MTRQTLVLLTLAALGPSAAWAGCPPSFGTSCQVGTLATFDVCEYDDVLDEWECRFHTEGSVSPLMVAVNDFSGAGETVYNVWGTQPNGDNFCCERTSTATDPICSVSLIAQDEDDNTGDTDDVLKFQWPTGAFLDTNSECSGLFSGYIYGDAGDDLIVGSSSTDPDYLDVLRGEEGNDEIMGHDGDDLIYGMDGDDVICGGAGDDDIHGNEGDDELYGGSGTDLSNGGNHGRGDACDSPGPSHTNATDCEFGLVVGSCPI